MPTLKNRVRISCVFALMFFVQLSFADTQQWSIEKANAWYEDEGWLIGSNYIPADAINQLEMWQAETFNPAQIDKELGWAAATGMNTMRVYLHDQVYAQDAAGFIQRIDEFLRIASKHGIKPMFVLFDSCWNPYPRLGPQHPPIPGVHNSGWVQSPGAAALSDTASYPKLKAYVQGIIGAFADDERVLAWDLWNEPDNALLGTEDEASAAAREKLARVLSLLPQVYEWAREMDSRQPLTSGVWHNDDWSSVDKLNAFERIQLEQSDIITFHVYDWPEALERRIKSLQGYKRPLICTEYLARSRGSTFDTSLPIARKYNVGMINWGLVKGKTQTHLPWESWQRPFTTSEPGVWFHDIFHPDGRPYRQAEIDQIRSLSEAAEREFEKRARKRRSSRTQAAMSLQE